MDVVGLGIPYYDLVINVDELPERDGAAGANEVFLQGGGKVATAMAAAARLGRSAGMIAKVGANLRGDFIVRDFAYNGVDTAAIVRGAKGTSSSFCLSLSEEKSKTRVFIGQQGTAGELQPEEIDFAYLAKASYLHLESATAASLAAARFARERGIVTVLDADSYQPSIRELIPLIDICIGSEFFCRDMFPGKGPDEACRALLEMGCRTAIITLGSRGCVGEDRAEGAFALECFQVKVTDTTGAGDVFHGAYIAGLLEGMGARESARFASAVSAIKCTAPGGRTGIPNRETVQKFLDTGVIDGREARERLEYYRQNF